MATELKTVGLAHTVDAAWMIALFLAIHGGDPAPNEGEVVSHDLQQAAALLAITALSDALDEKARGAVQQALAPFQKSAAMKTVDAKVTRERLEEMGFRIKEYAAEGAPAAGAADTFSRRPYCIRFRGQIVCVEFPGVGPHPIA
jgi:hypothetical protein